MDEHDDPNLSTEEKISDEIGERVRSLLAAAESAATAIRHEADEQAQVKRRAAESERQRLIEDARAEADALLQERIKRISELSDSIIEGGESLLMRIETAQEAKRQLEGVVRALGDAAQDLARERSQVRPAQPAGDDAVEEPVAPVRRLREDDGAEPAVAKAEPEPEPEPEADAEPEVVELRAADVEEVDAEPEQPAGREDESLAARLVALQMAVAGGNRGDVEQHLRRAFDLSDPEPILDDVFGAGSDADSRVVWPDKVTD